MINFRKHLVSVGWRGESPAELFPVGYADADFARAYISALSITDGVNF